MAMNKEALRDRIKAAYATATTQIEGWVRGYFEAEVRNVPSDREKVHSTTGVSSTTGTSRSLDGARR